MGSVLMIAYHYPPSAGSSGIHRTLKFSRYLPAHGWRPTVLTVPASAHTLTDGTGLPEGVRVIRAFAIDAARHLSVRGTYPKWLALPDRWVSWWPAAVARALHLIARDRPDVIWSTFPIATAHLIALTLHRVTGIPWVADFRDPMTDRDPSTGIEWPIDPAVRRVTGWIERLAIRHCARAVFTTPGTAAIYAERFPELPQSHWVTIPNGFDEEDFAVAEAVADRRHRADEQLVLVHSGALYRNERDPRAFFAALRNLKQSGGISARTLRVVLRASGSEEHYRTLLREHAIDDLVFLEPPIPYRDVLVEMLEADGLLIFQAANCNWQIPAKLYECLRAMRPILAVTDAGGDTAAVLRSVGIDTIVPIDDAVAIGEGLLRFIAAIRQRRAPVARPATISTFTRESRTAELAALLRSVVNT